MLSNQERLHRLIMVSLQEGMSIEEILEIFQGTARQFKDNYLNTPFSDCEEERAKRNKLESQSMQLHHAYMNMR